MADAAPAPVFQHVPLAAIDTLALVRDRTGLDAEPFAALKRSILETGVQTPITLFPLPRAADAPADAPRYGLIAGYRRLLAVRALHEDGYSRTDTIPALIHDETDTLASLRLMVEENAVRAEVSPWEEARLLVVTVDNGLFPNVEDAVERLHPTANRFQQARLRRVAHLVAELDGLIDAPETLSQRQLLRLATAVEAGFREPIALALEATRREGAERQWAAILPLMQEHEAEPAAPAPRRPGRPRRALRLRDTLAVRRERTRQGYVLRFSGPEATSGLLDEVLDRLEQMYTPCSDP